jgi:hypothetical protein
MNEWMQLLTYCLYRKYITCVQHSTLHLEVFAYVKQNNIQHVKQNNIKQI